MSNVLRAFQVLVLRAIALVVLVLVTGISPAVAASILL